MPAELTNHDSLIAQVHAHFAQMGWQPLLQVKSNGLKELSQEELERLLPKVFAAPDRVAAVTLVVEAIMPRTESLSEEAQDLSDSAVLKLRPNKPK